MRSDAKQHGVALSHAEECEMLNAERGKEPGMNNRSKGSKVSRISEAEWEVLSVLWSKAPRTANEVVEALADLTDWKPNTIKTLLTRLVKKNVVGFREEKRVYSYFPLVGREECLRAENRFFLERVYGGALKPMLVSFLKDETLTAEEIEELKRLLDRRD